MTNQVAFDGANSFYSKVKIPEDGGTQFEVLDVPSPDAGRAKTFKITIQYATAVDMRVIKHYPSEVEGTPMQQAIQVVDIVLRSAFDRVEFIRFKRSVFKIPDEPMLMKDNYELFIGLYQSFVMGERPYLNVDVSHKAFPSGAPSLEPIFREYIDDRDNRNPYRNVEEILRGLNMVYASPMTHERKTYKFNGIRGPADREMFIDEQDNNRHKSIFS